MAYKIDDVDFLAWKVFNSDNSSTVSIARIVKADLSEKPQMKKLSFRKHKKNMNI